MNRAPAASSLDPTDPVAFLRTGVLPFDPLEGLAGRSRRLANLVESVSRRRDVRELRARLLVLLLELRCPPGVRPRRSWYVPGAVARVGLEGLRRAWRGFHGGEAPCARTLRAHLGLLERVGALVRQPGEWAEAPTDPRAGASWRARHADTLHPLDSEDVAEAWERAGAPALVAHPEARTNPDAWRRHVGAWRRRPAGTQLELFATRPQAVPDRAGLQRASGEALGRDLAALEARGGGDALEVLEVAQAHGVALAARASFQLAASRVRLVGSLALLARALARGDWVRSRAAWVVRAHRFASPAELEDARRSLAGYVSVPLGPRPKGGT